MNPLKTDDRRQVLRLPCRILTRFDDAGQTHTGVITDCSEMGLFLQAQSLLYPNTKNLFRIGPQEKIQVHGKVIWNQREHGNTARPRYSGMGIQLLNPSSAYLNFILKLRNAQKKSSRLFHDPRFEVIHLVRFESEGAFLTEFVENLSRGGMYLSTDKPFKPGDPIRTLLEVPGSEKPLEIHGHVAYCLDLENAVLLGRSVGVGISFLKIPEEIKARLHQHLTRLEFHRHNRQRRRGGKIPEVGSLTDYLVPELLLMGMENQATGILSLEREGIFRNAYLLKGHPIYTESSVRAENIERYLVQQGNLSEKNLDSVYETAFDSDLQLGQAMVKQGLINGETLEKNILKNQEEKLINGFPWFDGHFTFSQTDKWPDYVSPVPLRTYHMVFSGIRQWYAPELLQMWMGLNEETVVQRQKVPIDLKDLPPYALKFLNKTTKPKKLKLLAQELSLPLPELYSIVFTTVIAGWTMLTPSSVILHPMPGPSPISPPPI